MNLESNTAVFEGGFAHAPVEAAHAFRAAMTVMARPGEQRRLSGAAAPAPASPAAAALVLTLCDPDTGLYLAGGYDAPALRDWVTFHTGAPIVPASEATFALGRWEDLQPLDQFSIGTAEYPDRSATLIVDGAPLDGRGAQLTGPGIADVAHLPLPDIAVLQANAALYPLGLDFFWTNEDRVAALPRSTQIVGEG